MGVSDIPLKDKLQYEKFMNKESDVLQVQGKTFVWSKTNKL